jgi:hypothetical protein
LLDLPGYDVTVTTSSAIVNAVLALDDDCVLDGEAIGDV